MSPGKALGGEGVGTAMGTPTLPLPLFSRLLLRLLGWLPPLLPLLNTCYRLHTTCTCASCYTYSHTHIMQAFSITHTQLLTRTNSSHTHDDKKQQYRLVQWQREWDGRICEIKKERRSNSRDFVARKLKRQKLSTWSRLHEIMCLRCREKSKKNYTNQSVMRWRFFL